MHRTSFFTLLIFLTLISTSVCGQDIPTVDFKPEVESILKLYEETISTIGDTTKNEADIKKIKKELINHVSSPFIRVTNDFSVSGNDSILPFNKYLAYLEKNHTIGFEQKLNLNNLEFTPLHIDTKRNEYRVIATLKKRFVLRVLKTSTRDSLFVNEKRILPDSTIQYDSISKEVEVVDTIQEKKFTNLSFYFTTRIMFGKYEPLKLVAVQVADKEPIYKKKLSELSQWWVNLSPDWQKKIREQLKFPELPTDYYLERVYGIREIDLRGVSKDDLAALSQFKGLQELNLSGIELDTLIALSGLTKLKVLNISKNNLTSLHGVENMERLEYINFSANEVVDISPLKKCTNLMTLIFNENQVEDISVVKNFPRLLTLRFENNKVYDLTPLRGCRAIKDLNIAKNKEITTLDPISHLVTMQRFNCFNTKIPSLAPLRNMTGMYYLNVGYTKINSLDEIRRLEGITYLNIGGNVINDFSALNSFPRLKRFHCVATKISDISPFMRLQSLKVFNAPNTDFSKEQIQRLKKKFPKCKITYFR